MTLQKCFLTVFIFLLNLKLFAQVISPSSEEILYSYTTTFQVEEYQIQQYNSAEDLIRFHASHLFGILQSPELIKKYGGSNYKSGGLGAPKTNPELQILEQIKLSETTYQFTYSLKNTILVHKEVAQKLIDKQSIKLPLPGNPFAIYISECTDEHYNSFDDYWYFYNPFKKECSSLREFPYAFNTEIHFEKLKKTTVDRFLDLQTLRSDNGNKKIFEISIIQGFSEDKKYPFDAGRINFSQTNKYFEKQGFKIEKLKITTPYPEYLLTKKLLLDSNEEIQVHIRHILVETAIQSESKIFAKFFKEASKQSDVVIYNGHSGLGGNLDLFRLQQKVGEFQFNPNKKQIYYFDSCSSYSYYLDLFSFFKDKASIDVMTNGLSSYFETSQDVMDQFFQTLLSPKTANPKWLDVLKKMEKPLKGESYLLNVGAI